MLQPQRSARFSPQSSWRTIQAGGPLLALLFLLMQVGCGSNGDGSAATPTATPTAQSAPTATATQRPAATVSATPTRTGGFTIQVTGLVVVNHSVSGRTSDPLAAPPTTWMEDSANAAFDKALGFADWAVVEDETQSGTTGADGRFEIGALPPGRYTLALTKTLDGNLLSAQVPFTVGSGGTTVVAEVSWGLVRSVSTYDDDGVEVRDVRDPYGRWVITRDGQITELGDTSVTLSDSDGDGAFDVTPCVDTLWSCGPDRSCGDNRVCGCVSSCPFCEDCGATVCQPIGLLPAPYHCDKEEGCKQPGDRCVCVSSCPECDDCAFSACVADCQSVQITAITVGGSVQLVVGENGAVSAVASLSNGRQIDVTTLVDWSSSDTDVASVDAFGAVSTHAIGTTTVAATLGNVASNDWTLTVTERPPLRAIFVQNVNCYYPLGDPREAVDVKPPVFDAPAGSPIWWPSCNQVVRIGTTIAFRALGQFGEGSYYQDITDEVTWQLSAPSVGSVTGGMFTAAAEGTTNLTASLDDVTSAPTSIRVVTESTVISLSIYPDQGGILIFDDRPPPMVLGHAAEIAPEPCLQCGYEVPVLIGDTLHFHATAHYDTGEWQDVTSSVAWRTSDATIATIDTTGAMLAIAVGTAVIDATLDEVTSNPVSAHVVAEATLQYMYLQPESTDRVVVKGGQLFFHAQGTYDLGFQRDVTSEATWHSSAEAVGSFDSAGVFSAHAAGSVQIWAQIGSVRTEPLNLEVYETSDVTYCDPNNVNRGVWSDDFNRVTLESDCASYIRPAVVTLRYSVTETQPHGGIFDPCLDLYVFQGNQKVRTLRQEGCGMPFLPSNAPEFDAAALKYQLRAFWDLKDENGQTVEPGTYTIAGIFYLYYDPVVTIDVAIN